MMRKNTIPLVASVATVVVALTVLVGVADTLADRRLDRRVALLAAPAPSVPADVRTASPEPGEERTAAMMPEADDADRTAPERGTPEPLPPIGHMRPQRSEEGSEPVQHTDDDAALPPDAPAPDQVDQAPAEPLPPTEEPSPPLEITPSQPQAPVELAETRDAQTAGDGGAPAPSDGGDADARVAVVSPRDEDVEPSAGGHIIVQEGNNLWHLARVIYGSGVYYLLIYEANRDAISDPNDILPGQTLMTPGVVPPEIVPPGLRDPIPGLEVDLPPGTAARLEAEHAARQRRR